MEKQIPGCSSSCFVLHLRVVLLVILPRVLFRSLASNRRRSRFEKRMRELGSTVQSSEVAQYIREGRWTLIAEDLHRRGWGVLSFVGSPFQSRPKAFIWWHNLPQQVHVIYPTDVTTNNWRRRCVVPPGGSWFRAEFPPRVSRKILAALTRKHERAIS